MSMFRRRPQRATTPPEVVPATQLPLQLQNAQERTWAAEDATRSMSVRLDAALERGRQAAVDRDKALAANVQALAALEALRDQARQLGQEVAALRHLLERAQAPRDAGRRCPECHEPMPFGTAHYCTRTANYKEGKAA